MRANSPKQRCPALQFKLISKLINNFSRLRLNSSSEKFVFNFKFSKHASKNAIISASS